MKKIWIWILMAVLLTSCQVETSTQQTSIKTDTCTIDSYRKSTQPITKKFSETLQDVSLSDESAVQTKIRTMKNLLNQADRLPCKDKYPLKHETLEYTIKHMIDAFEYALDGNLAEMQRSINKSELNVNQFNNWSVDVGP